MKNLMLEKDGSLEIGGEFSLDPSHLAGLLDEPDRGETALLDGLSLPGEPVLLGSGRQALTCLLMRSNDRTKPFLLPSYLCEAVLKPFLALNLPVQFYHIDFCLQPNSEELSSLGRNACGILIMRYFGFPFQQETIGVLEELHRKGLCIVEDITHSLLSDVAPTHFSDYYIASLRKWCALPDGGLLGGQAVRQSSLALPDAEIVSLRLLAHALKGEYLAGRFPDKPTFLRLFREAEQGFDHDLLPRAMSRVSKKLLGRVDWPALGAARRRNFLTLLERFPRGGLVRPLFPALPDNVCPLGFPVVLPAEHRETLRRVLISSNIFPPVHWKLPEQIGQSEFVESHRLSASILTIPCDQRYGDNEMEGVIEVIGNFDPHSTNT